MTLSPTKAALPVVAVVAYRHEVDTFDGQGYSCSKTILTENPRPNWHADHEITAIEESVPLVRQSDALTAIAEQAGEVERVERNRDMWKGQCERQAARLTELHAALLEGARRIEALKRECGQDPESPIAIQNSRYMGVSHFLRAALEKSA